MKYNTPEMELVHLEVGDIITSSPFGEGEDVTQDGEPVITTRPGSWG